VAAPPVLATAVPAAVDPAVPAATTPERVLIGEIKAVFGTRGWVKIHSETRPREAILDYRAWQVGHQQDWRAYPLEESRVQGPVLLAKLRGVDDREAAEALIGQRIAVLPADLEPLPAGSYYWRDLIGLSVVDTAGMPLGIVQGLAETGSNDVLRVQGERERLIPFVIGLYVIEVDLGARRMTVDWQPED